MFHQSSANSENTHILKKNPDSEGNASNLQRKQMICYNRGRNRGTPELFAQHFHTKNENNQNKIDLHLMVKLSKLQLLLLLDISTQRLSRLFQSLEDRVDY
jgi:hypothetical protein